MSGGYYKGNKDPHYAEWIERYQRIPNFEMERLAATFNPTSFNADEICAFAKECGMKYSPCGLYESACTLNCSRGCKTAYPAWKASEQVLANRLKLEQLGINYLSTSDRMGRDGFPRRQRTSS